MLNGFGRARPEQGRPTDQQQREIDTLTAEGNAIIDAHGEEPEDEAVYAGTDLIQSGAPADDSRRDTGDRGQHDLCFSG
jgi:hypothetical protein